jgi:hypothetical protein
MSLFNL